MDANKLEKLRKIDYSINPSCGLCVASFFSNANSDWGVCVRQFYKHQKHTDEFRKLSIHRAGHCPQFRLKDEKRANIEHYEEFYKGV